MNRSLRELQIGFMIVLPLLCAARALERVETLVVQPMAIQHEIFGQVVAYPWNYRDVDARFGEDGVTTNWRYALPAFPKPRPQCEPEAWRGNGGKGTQEDGCILRWSGGYVSAGWNQGTMWMQFDPKHIDPSDIGDRAQ